MTYRAADASDIPGIIALGMAMHVESVYADIAFDGGKVEAVLRANLGAPHLFCRVAVDRDGIIIGAMCGVLSEYFFSRETMASDLILYVAMPERGGLVAARLIRDFEAWARVAGARQIALGISAGIAPDRVASLYRRLGYRDFSASLTKELA